MLTSAIEAALTVEFSDWKHQQEIDAVCDIISNGQRLHDPNRVLAVLHDMDKRGMFEIEWAGDQPHSYKLRIALGPEEAY